MRKMTYALILLALLSGCGANEAQTPSESAVPGAAGTVEVAFENGGARISGPGAAFADGILNISRAGTYLLSGALDDGQILIDAGSGDTVSLVLDGVSVHNVAGPALYAPQAGKVVLVLSEGTENTFSDGAGSAAPENGEDIDAAIYVQDDLSVTGEGALTVSGNVRHGIRTQDVLEIKGGTLNITAAGDALRGRDGVSIQGGRFTLTAGGDGIQSNNDEDDAKGSVSIDGGEFIIQAKDDGIQAQNALTITGGSFQITADDDGLHAGGALRVSGGTLNIPACYEGLEGVSVTVSGGDITVTASDDAINAADGANGEMFVRISGGTLDLAAANDGIDSNGDIFLEGGTVKISGPSQGMEGAIDQDGAFTVTGGELITAGSVMGISPDSTQPALLISYAEQQQSGSVIEIKNASGETLLLYASKAPYSASGFTSPSFKIGETYSLYIDGEKKTDITLSAIVTTASDDGGAYTAGGFGRGGGGFGGDMRPGGGEGERERGDWGERGDGGMRPPGGGGMRPGDGGMGPPGGDGRNSAAIA